MLPKLYYWRFALVRANFFRETPLKSFKSSRTHVTLLLTSRRAEDIDVSDAVR